MKTTVKFITLGCKVNQYETQGMRENMGRAGCEDAPQGQEAAFVIINTCTVTADADKENRYWIRRAKRENPLAKIVVTGCGVERNRSEIEKMPEVDLVLMNHEKAEVAERLLSGCSTPLVQENPFQSVMNPRHLFTPLAISKTEGQGRAFVKIQDGCNHACSFCKVVMVRGRSRSRGLAEIIEEVKRLRDSGYREIVFAGIQLGAYGLDFERPDREALCRVLEACAEIEGIERLRLSSIEPTDIRPELIETMKTISKCCPQIHIPLQSGDDEILKRMNRRYTSAFYEDLILRLKEALPGFCLTLDVMAGFPGEEEIRFQNTIRLLEKIKPLKCHIFPYSRREGTRASKYEDLPKDIVRARVRLLMEKAAEWSLDVRRAYLGTRSLVLTESWKENGLLQGLTANYLKVQFPGEPDQVGQMIPVDLIFIEEDGFRGQIAEEEKAWKL